ncbi:MAG: hypothetical protein ACQERJ_10075 [Bacillota bacterium]
MKKLILITLTLVVMCSGYVSAETNLEVDFGLIEGQNIDEDTIPGGKMTLTTDSYNYKNLYDLVEITSTFGIDDPDYNFVSSDILFYSQFQDQRTEGNYVGVGFKQLFLDNSYAGGNYFSSDIEGYGIPIGVKLEEDYGKTKAFAKGSIFKGVYTMTFPGEDIESEFSGVSIDVGIKYKLESVDLKLSYKQEDYSFDKDNDIVGSTDFDDDYKGIFLGIDF